MADFVTNDDKIPKKLAQFEPLETSDKPSALETVVKPPVVEALQDEVIRLRQESLKFAKKGAVDTPDSSDSLTGKVEDYQPLIASLRPSETVARVSQHKVEPANADQDLLSVFQAQSSPISLALQDNLVVSPEKQPEIKVKSIVAFNSEPHLEPIPEPSKASGSQETIALSAPDSQLPSFLSKTESNLSAPMNIQIASSSDQSKKYTPEPTIAKQSTGSTRTYTPVEQTPANAIAANDFNPPSAAQNNASKRLDGLFSQSSNDRPLIASQNIPAPASPQQQQIEQSTKESTANSTTSEKNIAFNASQQTNPTLAERPTTRNASEGQLAATSPTDKSLGANNENQVRLQKDQIAFNPQDISKPSNVAHDGSASVPRRPESVQLPIGRSSTIASANTTDYSQSTREPIKELAKEAKDKDLQFANATTYPKFGGAAPVEESSKPIIQQQKPQSYQSSLARDSAPEKAHPLSESFVSSKILSQPNKESPADFKSGDGKITTAKTTDGKSTEVKVDAKPSDFKTADVRFPEGRAADPRSLDASHLSTLPTAKAGTEAHGLNPTTAQPGQALPGDKVILAAANPATAGKTDNQPTGKGDGSTKPDAAHTDASIPDKSGKKPEGVDDKKDTTATAKGPGTAADTGKVPGGKSFHDLLDFIDKADQGGDIKPGGKGNIPLGGSNILSPDDVLITGTAAVGQAGFPGTTEETNNDEADNDKLSHRRKKYIVQPGDTLDSIAKTELGDERFSSLILTINQANIPSKQENGKSIAIKLQPGQILWLPSDYESQVHADLYLLDN